MADLFGRRGSLERRVVGWTALIVLLTLVLFAVVVYLLVNEEMREALRAGPPDEIGEDGRDEVIQALLIAGPIALLAGVLATLALVRRALAPLGVVVRSAREMGAGSLHLRLPAPARADELGELVTELNALFGRLEEGFHALARHAADASHELRTPLAVMIAELEVALRQARPPDEWREIGARTLDELRRLAELVAALLELSRAGHGQTFGETVDLALVVRDVTGALAGRADEAGLTFEVPLAEDAIQVAGHRGALEGALRNLVGNALRYTPRGGRVRVSCGRDFDGSAYVDIEDSGPGVGDGERESIFTPFARGEAGRTADGHGLGLGLAIARRVLDEGHQGRLEVSRSPLGGARFHAWLPARVTRS